MQPYFDGKKRKKKMEYNLKKWKTNQSTKINLIGCDTIVNLPSFHRKCFFVALLLFVCFIKLKSNPWIQLLNILFRADWFISLFAMYQRCLQAIVPEQFLLTNIIAQTNK